ncbi:MAG: dihydrolipoamide acetyltransferase family protein [Chloroflexota bacterium]|jgi:pyruvate dehydrogenase E2 component (dihydrolipoamide acetyltransferase)
MATDVIMPKVDMDQETGTVARWLKNEGDEVRQGEVILEIETDKVAIDVEAPASGILTNILVGEGETVPIAAVIATILDPGEGPPGEGPPPGERPPAAGEAAPELATSPAAASGNGVPVTPVARNVARASGVDLTTVTGSGPRGKVTRKDVEQRLAAAQSQAKPAKPYATPAARRVAGERNVDLASLSGSGPDGRIQAADVLSAAQATVDAATPAVEVMPLRGKRRTIAERLTASYQSTPHIHFRASIDMTGFNEARSRLNAQAEKSGGTRISTTALLAKIVAQTLVLHPWLNSSFKAAQGDQEAEVYLYRDVNLGIAVALADGLIVPVVRDAANKGLAQIAAEVEDLAARARDGQLAPAEVRDGTFTISNLGPFDVEEFTAIINPPQAAILAVGATKPDVVPDDDGQIVVRPIMRITLAADHRVIDGAVAAHFMADLQARLESPVLLLL